MLLFSYYFLVTPLPLSILVEWPLRQSLLVSSALHYSLGHSTQYANADRLCMSMSSSMSELNTEAPSSKSNSSKSSTLAKSML